MYNADRLTDIYVKYGITPNQFYVLYLVYRKDWKNLYKYKENVVSKISESGKNLHGFNIDDELQPLIDKGYLEQLFNGRKFDIIDLMVTPTFSESIFIDTHEAGEELYKVFPAFLDINGQRVVAKKGGDINGRYYGKEETIELYAKKIGNAKDKHERIIKQLKMAVEQKLVNFTLRSFVYDEMWELFEDLGSIGKSKKNEFI